MFHLSHSDTLSPLYPRSSMPQGTTLYRLYRGPHALWLLLELANEIGRLEDNEVSVSIPSGPFSWAPSTWLMVSSGPLRKPLCPFPHHFSLRVPTIAHSRYCTICMLVSLNSATPLQSLLIKLSPNT